MKLSQIDIVEYLLSQFPHSLIAKQIQVSSYGPYLKAVHVFRLLARLSGVMKRLEIEPIRLLFTSNVSFTAQFLLGISKSDIEPSTNEKK